MLQTPDVRLCNACKMVFVVVVPVTVVVVAVLVVLALQ